VDKPCYDAMKAVVEDRPLPLDKIKKCIQKWHPLFYRTRLLSHQTLIAPDFDRSRLLSQQTFIAADFYRSRRLALGSGRWI